LKIVIVNEGVQPELIQLAIEIIDQKVDLRYLTRSSIAEDEWFLSFVTRISRLLKVRSILEKRVIKLPSHSLLGSFRFASFILRFLPRWLTKVPSQMVTRKFYIRTNKFLASYKPDYVIVNEGRNGLKITSDSGTKTIIVLSTTTKRHQNFARSNDGLISPQWIDYYSPQEFSEAEIARQENDFELCSLIIVPSEFVRASLPESAKTKARIAHLGFDSAVFNYSNTRRKRVVETEPLKCVYIGQFTQRKGIGYLLEAFSESDLPKGSTLHFVGLMPNGRRRILEKQFAGIRFVRPRSRVEIRGLLDQSDLFVLPSIVEGFALSAIEALATGIPILVTNNTLDSQIDHLSNGLIAQSASKHSIIEMLEFAARNPRKMDEIGHSGSSLAVGFTWTVYRKRIKGILETEIF